ncbi:MAG: HD domain-containing protein [Candidatus Moranbacteria bacterium]|jgi:putative hydrolase of HD superfamily|nr:HD domain-containing protein [Candidatus Moranbacteria bacterium]
MLQKLLGFAKVMNALQTVERVIRVKDSERWENDVEHSYSLAMLAWYIIDSQKLPLDREKVLCYALAHDLVEVYAGDTYIFSKDEALLESKGERERLAGERLVQEFPEVPEMHAAIRHYVAKDDAESRFVYALDKIEPLLKLYLDGGRTWKEKNVTLEMAYDSKVDKVALSPEIKAYFDELMVVLRKEEAQLFPPKS